jgi:DMSO/TMAO reductase YedYZ molybdopterin-dependent catalytic subunit
VFLGMVAAGAVGVVAGSHIQDGLDALITPIQSRDPTGLSDLIPSGNTWRYYTITGGYPTETDAAYRLQVDGLVRSPLTLGVADLKAMPSTFLVRDFQCVTGWRVRDVHWEGVALGHLLDAAGVQPQATALHFESFDGMYTESLTLDQARRPDVIVAYSMLGGPVTTEHGGPVRLYCAPMYGYKSVKWLSRITLTAKVEEGYWEQEGNYAVNGWVGKSNGRNDPAT